MKRRRRPPTRHDLMILCISMKEWVEKWEISLITDHTDHVCARVCVHVCLYVCAFKPRVRMCISL